MFSLRELKKLAALTAPDRAFLSVYLAGPASVAELEKKFAQLRRLLLGDGAAKDEQEYFDANVRAVREYLHRQPLQEGALCLFSCWVLDFFRAFPLSVPVPDHVSIDASPFIRPLAELRAGHATTAVVIADNHKSRIFLVSLGDTGPEEVIKGHVKNHVKVGGWSQQRYERRRDKELHHYARETVAALTDIGKTEEIDHVLMVGSRETLRAIQEQMPRELQQKVLGKAVDLSKGEAFVNKEILRLFQEEERLTGQEHWEKIRAEYLRGGLAVVGPEEILPMAQAQRIEEIVVDRTFQPLGMRCRNCQVVQIGLVKSCPSCGGGSLYLIGIFNEILDLVYRAGGQAHFTDPLPTLTEVGGIAALLRY